MIKKLVVALALLILPLTAAAGPAEREMLLTDDGTLFTVERMWANEYAFTTDSNSFLVLSQRKGDNILKFIVPATLTSGVHKDPALAYDSGTKTLFVFWQRTYSILHSELAFIAFHADGTWSDATTFGSLHSAHENLRIAVTRKVEVEIDGEKVLQPEINVHAVWWEYDAATRKQSARYTLLTIEDGKVTTHTEPRALADFLTAPVAATSSKNDTPAALDQDLLKHPALFTNPTQESVDVVFGDVRTSEMNRVRIRPTKPSIDARIRIPVGIRDNNVGKPKFKATTSGSRISAINGDPDGVAFYQKDGDAIQYVMFKGGEWTAPQAIVLDEQISSDAAVEAIRRLLNER